MDLFDEQAALADLDKNTNLETEKQLVEQNPDEIRTIVSDNPTEVWSNQFEFFLSILGYAVDLANVWRFPYICYINGGGAFLVPYFILLAVTAIPMFYMDLILGQKHRRGAIALWDFLPIFRGIGMCQIMVTFIVGFYYNTISAWCLLFLVQSINDRLPWTYCDQIRGNTPDCVDFTHFMANRSAMGVQQHNLAPMEYFERVILKVQRSNGLVNLGPMQWQIVVCTMAIFGIIFLALRHGVKSSGKVVYVTAICPYIFLAILLINGSLLDGAGEGILYFIRPRFDRLLDLQVWADAAIQIFFSTGAGFGVHITYATYNPRRYNCLRDCLVTSVINALTSVFAGFTVFAYLGYLANLMNTGVENVVGEGPGLVFQVYPFALSTLPMAPLWSILFFALLIMLGLDSAMGAVETIVRGLWDMLSPRLKGIKHSRLVILIMVLSAKCGMAMVNATSGGIYVFNLMDRYVAGTSLLVGALMQVIAIAWFYGMDQLCEDIKSMNLPNPGLFWRLCWKFVTPFLLTFMIAITLTQGSSLRYFYGTVHPELFPPNATSISPNTTLEITSFFYDYPDWSGILGWGLTCISISFIPLTMFVNVFRYGCHFNLKKLISLGPADCCEYPCFRRNTSQKTLEDEGRYSSKESQV